MRNIRWRCRSPFVAGDLELTEPGNINLYPGTLRQGGRVGHVGHADDNNIRVTWGSFRVEGYAGGV